MDTKTISIGDTITIRCVEGRDCDKCCFRNSGGVCRFENRLVGCNGYGRSDGKDVHFEIVDDNAGFSVTAHGAEPLKAKRKSAKKRESGFYTKATIKEKFRALVEKYADYVEYGISHLMVFNAFPHEPMLGGSTIDKITSDGSEICFYYDANINDWDYLEKFKLTDLREFYDEISGMLEKGERI